MTIPNHNHHVEADFCSSAHDERTSERITRSLIEHVHEIAVDCEAAAIIVYSEAIDRCSDSFPDEYRDKILYVTKTEAERQRYEANGIACISVPNVPLTRMGQVKIAIFRALSRKMVRCGDTVICLAGLTGTSTLDMILAVQIGHDFEMFVSADDQELVPSHIHPVILDRVVDIACELGRDGREGKPVGAVFVVGDSERVKELSRQLILNPFQGYTEPERNLQDPSLEETVKELAALDGAFIIRGDGVIEACGAYLKTTNYEAHGLPRGLGTRHHAAAAITALTNSIAVTVSESAGTVTIFRAGTIVTVIKQPRSQPPSSTLLYPGTE